MVNRPKSLPTGKISREGYQFKEKERDNKEARGISFTDDFQAPDQINWPTLIFFWMKLTVLSIAYGIMIASVFQELS